jgi:hypothetical protein
MSGMADRLNRAQEQALEEARKDETHLGRTEKKADSKVALSHPTPVAPSHPVQAKGKKQGIYILPSDDRLIDGIAKKLVDEGVVSQRSGGLASLIYRIGLHHLAQAFEQTPALAIATARSIAKPDNHA